MIYSFLEGNLFLRVFLNPLINLRDVYNRQNDGQYQQLVEKNLFPALMKPKLVT